MVLPNQLTTLRIILTPVFLFFFLSENPVYIRISLLIYLIAAITDWYDGWLARKFDYITDWGKFMDPLADKVLNSTAFIGLVLVNYIELWMVLIIIIRDILVTALRLYADYKKKGIITSKSAKWKTFLQMAFLYYCLLLYGFETFSNLPENINTWIILLSNQQSIYYAMLAITILTVYTGIEYIYKNKKNLRSIFKNEN
ncbi:MAG: CDP-diacylglycerol--glycerol-3-phosphate 3-phosphatidyltransferase [Ignavibacteriales bacterium]|nr:CDP-diacylglycerol--glycerol-3-phosphate 3-phosphatidyltransferase [Ignavibacteriales bacterium]